MVTQGHPIVLPILVPPTHLLKCSLTNLLSSCLPPHKCETMGLQLTCQTCFQCFANGSLNCNIGKSHGLTFVHDSTPLYILQICCTLDCNVCTQVTLFLSRSLCYGTMYHIFHVHYTLKLRCPFWVTNQIYDSTHIIQSQITLKQCGAQYTSHSSR